MIHKQYVVFVYDNGAGRQMMRVGKQGFRQKFVLVGLDLQEFFRKNWSPDNSLFLKCFLAAALSFGREKLGERVLCKLSFGKRSSFAS